MKRILLGAVTLIASLTAVSSAQAGRTFGLLVGCHLLPCCGRCGCEFTVRQYNAFSPVCSGNITCDGIMPFGSCGVPGMMNYSGVCNGCPSGCMGGMCGSGGMCGPMGCNAGFPCCEGFPSGPMPMMSGPAMPQLPAPMPGAPSTMMPPGHSPMQPCYPGYNVQPVGYYPNYGYARPMPAYPMMNPYSMGQMPYYWNPMMGGR